MNKYFSLLKPNSPPVSRENLESPPTSHRLPCINDADPWSRWMTQSTIPTSDIYNYLDFTEPNRFKENRLDTNNPEHTNLEPNPPERELSLDTTRVDEPIAIPLLNPNSPPMLRANLESPPSSPGELLNANDTGMESWPQWITESISHIGDIDRYLDFSKPNSPEQQVLDQHKPNTPRSNDLDYESSTQAG